MNFEKLKSSAPIVLRLGIALVFLWFSFSQFKSPDNWTHFLPSVMPAFLSSNAWIYVNASFELIFGSLLLLGVFVRTSALLLAIHLVGIVFTLGYTPIAIRDFGLAVATVSIFLHGADRMCLIREKQVENSN